MGQLDKVIDSVSTITRVPKHEIKSHHRSRDYVYARQMVWWIGYTLLGETTAGMARRWNKDHSTVLYGINAMHDLIKSSAEVKENIHDTIQQFLTIILRDDV